VDHSRQCFYFRCLVLLFASLAHIYRSMVLGRMNRGELYLLVPTPAHLILGSGDKGGQMGGRIFTLCCTESLRGEALTVPSAVRSEQSSL
jgi:hypothetical protein